MAPSIIEKEPDAWAEFSKALDEYTADLRKEVGEHLEKVSRQDAAARDVSRRLKIDTALRRMDALTGSWEEGKHPRKGGGSGGGQFTSGGGGGSSLRATKTPVPAAAPGAPTLRATKTPPGGGAGAQAGANRSGGGRVSGGSSASGAGGGQGQELVPVHEEHSFKDFVGLLEKEGEQLASQTKHVAQEIERSGENALSFAAKFSHHEYEMLAKAWSAGAGAGVATRLASLATAPAKVLSHIAKHEVKKFHGAGRAIKSLVKRETPSRADMDALQEFGAEIMLATTATLFGGGAHELMAGAATAAYAVGHHVVSTTLSKHVVKNVTAAARLASEKASGKKKEEPAKTAKTAKKDSQPQPASSDEDDVDEDALRLFFQWLGEAAGEMKELPPLDETGEPSDPAGDPNAQGVNPGVNQNSQPKPNG